jgi:hypothetical protein
LTRALCAVRWGDSIIDGRVRAAVGLQSALSFFSAVVLPVQLLQWRSAARLPTSLQVRKRLLPPSHQHCAVTCGEVNPTVQLQTKQLKQRVVRLAAPVCVGAFPDRRQPSGLDTGWSRWVCPTHTHACLACSDCQSGGRRRLSLASLQPSALRADDENKLRWFNAMFELWGCIHEILVLRVPT